MPLHILYDTCLDSALKRQLNGLLRAADILYMSHNSIFSLFLFHFLTGCVNLTFAFIAYMALLVLLMLNFRP